MVSKKWILLVAWIAVIALILAIVALGIILSSNKFTGGAIFSGITPNSQIKNISFAFTADYSFRNKTNAAIIRLIPRGFLSSKYNIDMLDFFAIENDFGLTYPQAYVHTTGDVLSSGCEPRFSDINNCAIMGSLIPSENNGRGSLVVEIFNKKDKKLVAFGSITNSYDKSFNRWGDHPFYWNYPLN